MILYSTTAKIYNYQSSANKFLILVSSTEDKIVPSNIEMIIKYFVHNNNNNSCYTK